MRRTPFRAPGTIRELTRMFHEELQVGQTLGFCMFPHPMGPFPPRYEGGNRTTIGILYRKNLPGCDEIKQKFSSARKARSVHANMFMASAQGGPTSKAIQSDKGHKTLSATPTDTKWFSQFMTGLRSRIGERHRQDAAISIALMVELQKRLEANWQEAVIKNNMGLMRETAEDGAFFLLTYCGNYSS
jgi:hypothetical protein